MQFLNNLLNLTYFKYTKKIIFFIFIYIRLRFLRLYDACACDGAGACCDDVFGGLPRFFGWDWDDNGWWTWLLASDDVVGAVAKTTSRTLAFITCVTCELIS